MTHKILNRDPKDEILKAFRLFDDDETGKISFKNLKRVAKELGERMTDEELQEMIDEADRDGDGEVNEEEFLRIMKKSRPRKARRVDARIASLRTSRRDYRSFRIEKIREWTAKCGSIYGCIDSIAKNGQIFRAPGSIFFVKDDGGERRRQKIRRWRRRCKE